MYTKWSSKAKNLEMKKLYSLNSIYFKCNGEEEELIEEYLIILEEGCMDVKEVSLDE